MTLNRNVEASLRTEMINIDYSRDLSLPEFSIRTVEDRYLTDGETSPQDAFARAARTFSDDAEMAQRLYDYASKMWFMFSTPVLSNGGTTRGLPISCFLNYIPDSRVGLRIIIQRTPGCPLSEAGLADFGET